MSLFIYFSFCEIYCTLSEKIVKPKETVVESKLKKQVRGSIKQGDLLPQP